MKIQELTKAEEQVMQILWKLQQAYVKEIVNEMPEPKPAYNTVSTLVRILQEKKLVSHEAVGRSHRYYPLISKEQYRKYKMEKLMSGYFDGSLSKMVSAFADRQNLSTRELEEIQQIIENQKSK